MRLGGPLSLAIAFLFYAVPLTAQEHDRPSMLTCDRDVIDPQSYYLTTTAQAENLLSPRSGRWDSLEINSHIDTLRDLNLDARQLAERARERDPRNVMAHSILARQYLILNWQRAADEAWRMVIDNGGAVVWTATLYDADYKSYFLVAFDRSALRIYRTGQFTGPTISTGSATRSRDSSIQAGASS